MFLVAIHGKLTLSNMKVNNSESKKSYNELDTSRLLSESEACSVAGITLDTVRSYTQFGLLKPVIRNQKPFYRFNELTLLFNIQESVPTLDKLLAPEIEEEASTSDEEVATEIKEEASNSVENLPALRIEDVMLQNQSLNTKIKSLEDERDWLRRRVEMLEERSAREQMLMLKEKETLSEIINATLVKDNNRESRKSFSFKSYIKRIALPFFAEK